MRFVSRGCVLFLGSFVVGVGFVMGNYCALDVIKRREIKKELRMWRKEYIEELRAERSENFSFVFEDNRMN